MFPCHGVVERSDLVDPRRCCSVPLTIHSPFPMNQQTQYDVDEGNAQLSAFTNGVSQAKTFPALIQSEMFRGASLLEIHTNKCVPI